MSSDSMRSCEQVGISSAARLGRRGCLRTADQSEEALGATRAVYREIAPQKQTAEPRASRFGGLWLRGGATRAVYRDIIEIRAVPSRMKAKTTCFAVAFGSAPPAGRSDLGWGKTSALVAAHNCERAFISAPPRSCNNPSTHARRNSPQAFGAASTFTRGG
jgi:hypothetical protein